MTKENAQNDGAAMIFRRKIIAALSLILKFEIRISIPTLFQLMN